MRLFILISILLSAVLLSGCPKGAEYAGRLAGVSAEDVPQMPQTWNAWFGRTLRENKPGGLEVMQAQVLADEAKSAAYAYYSAYGNLPTSLAQIEPLIMHRAKGAQDLPVPLASLSSESAPAAGSMSVIFPKAGEIGVRVPSLDAVATGRPYFTAIEDVGRTTSHFGPYQPGRSTSPSEQMYADFLYRRTLEASVRNLILSYTTTFGQRPESWDQVLDAFGLVPVGYTRASLDSLRPTDPSMMTYEAFFCPDHSALVYRNSDLLPDWDGDGWPDWDWVGSRIDINLETSKAMMSSLPRSECSREHVAERRTAFLRIYSERRPLEQLLPETGTPQSLREAQPDAAPAATLANAARE